MLFPKFEKIPYIIFPSNYISCKLIETSPKFILYTPLSKVSLKLSLKHMLTLAEIMTVVEKSYLHTLPINVCRICSKWLNEFKCDL